MPLHPEDAFWPSLSRNYALPAPEAVKELHLKRDPYELRWFNDAGEIVACCELWTQHMDGQRTSFEGYRLLVKRVLLQEYANRREMDVLFAVRVSRNRRESYGRRHDSEPKEKYDLGTRRIFLLSELK
jgi:hypothetical protein